MDSLCEACGSGASGIAGHGHLRVHSMVGAVMTFRCSRCEAMWTRNMKVVPGEPFQWRQVTDLAVSAGRGLGLPMATQ